MSGTFLGKPPAKRCKSVNHWAWETDALQCNATRCFVHWLNLLRLHSGMDVPIPKTTVGSQFYETHLLHFGHGRMRRHAASHGQFSCFYGGGGGAEDLWNTVCTERNKQRAEGWGRDPETSPTNRGFHWGAALSSDSQCCTWLSGEDLVHCCVAAISAPHSCHPPHISVQSTHGAPSHSRCAALRPFPRSMRGPAVVCSCDRPRGRCFGWNARKAVCGDRITETPPLNCVNLRG